MMKTGKFRERLKRLRMQSGFSLVECLIAMAIMTIMAAIVAMIVTSAAQMYKENAETRENLDEQIELLANNTRGSKVDEVEIDDGITFVKEDGSSFTINTKDEVGTDNEVLILNKKSVKDSELQLDVFEADYSILSESIAETGPLVSANGSINPVQIEQIDDVENEDGSHTLTWEYKFRNTTGGDLHLTLILPIGVKDLKPEVVNSVGTLNLNLLNGRKYEIETSDVSEMKIKLEFTLPRSLYNNRYKNLSSYFLDIDNSVISMVNVSVSDTTAQAE